MLLKVKQQTADGFALSPSLQQQLKTQLLNDTITQTVLIQAAEKAGFVITPVQAVTVLKQLPQFQEKGVFSKDRFEQIIARLNYTRESLLGNIAKSLLLNQVATGIQETSFVLPGDANQMTSLLEQKRDFEYAIIPSASFKKAVPPADIANYYNQHKNEFMTPEKIQLEYVQLNVQQLKPSIQVSEQEIADYFSGNSALSKDNKKDIAKAKEALLQQKAEQEFITASDKLTDLTYTNSGSLIEAANALGLKVEQSEFFSQQGGATNLTKSPKILNTVFAADFIKSNINSNLIELSPGTVVVVRIKEVQPAAPLALNAVKSKIEQKLAANSIRVLATQKGEQLLSQIKTKSDFKKILTATGYGTISKQQISRSQSNIDKQLLQLAFTVSPSDSKGAAGLALNNGDYAIVLLNKADDLPVNKITEQQRTTMAKAYSDIYGKSEYQMYVNNQMNKAKIKLFKATIQP
jgi:peptidyl-prolyl cis-trans isomerase D